MKPRWVACLLCARRAPDLTGYEGKPASEAVTYGSGILVTSSAHARAVTPRSRGLGSRRDRAE